MTSRLWIDDRDEDVTGDDENEEVTEGSGDAYKKRAQNGSHAREEKPRKKHAPHSSNLCQLVARCWNRPAIETATI